MLSDPRDGNGTLGRLFHCQCLLLEAGMESEYVTAHPEPLHTKESLPLLSLYHHIWL